MKFLLACTGMLALLAMVGCSNVSPDAVELNVDFTWEGFVPCGPGTHPEIRVSGIPAETKVLIVKLTDHGLSHGRQSIPYDGTGIIPKHSLDRIETPCPIGDPGKYKYKILAANQDEVIIGSGSLTRYYPEKK